MPFARFYQPANADSTRPAAPLPSAAMSEATSQMPAPLSKGAIFFRRLFSFVLLWTIVIGALFSGHKALSDWVFLAIIATLAVCGLLEFYGMVQKLGYACFDRLGVFGGLLLIISTFVYISGDFRRAASPSRMNDFETSFFIVFVLGLCIRQFVSRRANTGILAISTTLLGLMYVP